MVGGFEGASSSLTISNMSYLEQWNLRVTKSSDAALGRITQNKALLTGLKSHIEQGNHLNGH